MDDKSKHIIKGICHKTLHEYFHKGKSSFHKKRQLNRLVTMICFMLDKKKEKQIKSIGRKDITIFFKEHCDESEKTLREKYLILKRFFGVFNSKVDVERAFNEARAG